MHGHVLSMQTTLYMIGSEQWIELFDDDAINRYKDNPNLCYRGKLAYIRNSPEPWMKETFLRNEVYAIYAMPDRYHGTKIIIETRKRKEIRQPWSYEEKKPLPA